MEVRLALLTLAALLTNVSCQEPTSVPICPPSSGVSIPKLRVPKIDKLDLLFVVDNSSSMADRQLELARALPELLTTVTKPPIVDVHVGVITSSLGSHGTSACAVEATNPANNDRAHLLPRAGDGCAGAIALSALSWVYQKERDPRAGFHGAEGVAPLKSATACIVQSAGEAGCGYEETWEALFHFLVDPAPYAKAEVKCTFGVDGDACGSNKIVVEGLDEELLAQRKAFLRPDSVLAVVILSDENDASLKPAGLNWLPWGSANAKMLPGWAACAAVPDDFEPETAADFKKLHEEYRCFSCFEDSSDPRCKTPWSEGDPDSRNLRAWRQTQRFGYNFLWGRQRYVDAFTKPQVYGSDNKLAANPIFQGGFRTQDLIVVATIVGVPGDLVRGELTAEQWDKIVGPIGTRDPHMIESIAPRAGLARFAGDRAIDPVSGGERDLAGGDDLQYACIGKRVATTPGIDCAGPDADQKNPLCSATGQTYFKAYPGLRHLRIARDLGVSGYVASICDESYASALSGLAKKLEAAANNDCMRTTFEPDPIGHVSCKLWESLAAGGDSGKRCEDLAKGLCTPGAAPCSRAPKSAEAAAEGLWFTIAGSDGIARPTQAVARGGNVYVGEHLLCEVQQFSGDALHRCIDDPAFNGDGWCYTQKAEFLSAQCRATGAPGTLRSLGGAAPRPGSERFTACGAPADDTNCR